MPIDNAKNFAKVTVSTGYDASATSIVLTTGHGARLPTAPFNVVWWNSTDYSDPSDDPNVEVVRVTGVSTDTLTVTRAQEGTTGSTKNTAAKVYKMIAGLTAKVINTDIPSVIPVAGAPIVTTAVANFDSATLTTRYAIVLAGAGTVVTNATGLTVNTGSTSGSSNLTWGLAAVAAGNNMALGSPLCSANIRLFAGADFDFFWGMSAGAFIYNAPAKDWTEKHIGFKMTRVSSGTMNLYATQANDVTETASASLTTLNNGDWLDLIFKVNGTASVDYYFRKNDSALSSATNLTTNMPTSVNLYTLSAGMSNRTVSTSGSVSVGSMSYQR